MNGPEHDDLMAAEYVLGLSDPETRLRLDKLLTEDDAFAAEVLHWQKAFSGIDLITPEATPRAAVWRQIERDINRNAATTKLPLRHPGFWLGWGLAAALSGLLLFTYLDKPEIPETQQPIAVLSGTQPDAQFVVTLDRAASHLQLSALNITLPQNKNLQLWLIRGSAPPRSLGLITHPDHNVFPLPPGTLDHQTVLAISLEPVGGSTLSGPSGPVIFQGKVTRPSSPGA